MNTIKTWEQLKAEDVQAEFCLSNDGAYRDLEVTMLRAELGRLTAEIAQQNEHINAEAGVMQDMQDRVNELEAELTASSFPERNTSLKNTEQGIFRKFEVRRVDGSDVPGGKHDGCEYFVLYMTHDKHATAALRAYADSCRTTHPRLSEDLVSRFGAAPVPEGCQLVPVEPTREQLIAAHDGPLGAEGEITKENESWLIDMYKTMLAAAPRSAS